MNIKFHIFGCLLGLIVLSLSSCQSSTGNQTGSEYMPDMAHSVAYEANTYGYYYNNRWGTEDELHKMVQPRLPVSGTIARGFAGSSMEQTGRGVPYRANGSVPYYYSDTEEERTKAAAEIIDNPYPITSNGLAEGKLLYNIQCAICHGEKGDGDGYLVRDDGGKYPVQPANFMGDTLTMASNGRYYHAIMYGKNLMGGYADKLSYGERWNVIHYIRSMQAANKKLEYSEKSNTLNKIEIPYAVILSKKEAEAKMHIVHEVKDTLMSKEAHGTGDIHK
ncbi:MAG: c-type cytochrome [Saprospiraceae bacterium]|nr:c-type cytochrome [Saprospiraceae bacterium]